MSDIAELAAHWPDMPDLAGGVDRFAEYPVAGEPPLTSADAPATVPSVIEAVAEDYAQLMCMGDLGGVEIL